MGIFIKLNVQEPILNHSNVYKQTALQPAFPIAYALMTRKTEMAYTSVLDHIKTCVPGTIASNIVTDYEVGLSNALTNVFPEVRLQKCWFHMAQALEKNAKDFGIQRHIYSSDNALHTMFRMSKALSLLPADKIIEGFEVVSEARLSPNIEIAEKYVSYFKNQWMEQTLIKIEEEYGTKYERMQQRPALRARRRTYVQLDRKISAACERLAQNRICVREFLLYTGHLAYDAERRRGVGHINEIVPPQIVETIEEQILTENVENNVIGGIGIGVQIQNRFEQQQRNAEQFPVQDFADFEIDEDRDPVFNAIREMEVRRMARELEDIPIIQINNTITLPRPINYCDICLSNQKTHACLPCGHKCLCSECADKISNRCPICNTLITNVVCIFD